MYRRIRNIIFKSGLIRFIAIFIRINLVFKFNIINLYKSIVWLLRREEFTNYMYEITELNRNQMIGAVSQVSGLSLVDVEEYFFELEKDTLFSQELTSRGKKLKRKYELLFPIPYARRIVWYALIRIFKPEVVVESGTEKGLGSLIIAKALEKNGTGTLFTLDIDIYAGSLLRIKDQNIKLIIGSSIESLKEIRNIDFFIQDSNHSVDYEIQELNLIKDKLNKKSIVISDNAHESNALFNWSKSLGRRYMFVPEKSKNHWHSGDGIGISY